MTKQPEHAFEEVELIDIRNDMILHEDICKTCGINKWLIDIFGYKCEVKEKMYGNKN